MEAESERANARLQEDGGKAVIFESESESERACRNRRMSITKIWKDSDVERDEKAPMDAGELLEGEEEREDEVEM
jgi:hypothetical protein